MQPNLDAALRVVGALQELGRLEVVDDARVTLFLELARVVDAKPTDAGLWKQYREAEATLRETDDVDDSLTDLLSALRDPAHPEP